MGIIGRDIALGRQMWLNRQNPKLYEAFRLLYGQDDLWVSLDRVGLMRPTKGVKLCKLKPQKYRIDIGEPLDEAEPAESMDQPEWKTFPLWLHWDLNPWLWTSSSEGFDYEFMDFISENNGSRNDGKLKLQGILNFVDNRRGDGGFCCVPGFHAYLKDYCAATSRNQYARRLMHSFTFANVPKGDPMARQVEQIGCRAGSLVVWMGEEPHCNYPNDSTRFRINQYVKMFPAHEGAPNTDRRKEIVLEETASVAGELTALGRKLLGLDSWLQ